MEEKKRNNTIFLKVLLVDTRTGTSKKTGNDYVVHTMYVKLPDGSVGNISVFGDDMMPEPGQIAEITLMSSFNGELVPRVIALHPVEILKQA